MKCAWQALINILPLHYRAEVYTIGCDSLQELRLRQGAKPELVMGNHSHWLKETVTAEDITFTVNSASRYSPWSAATIRRGYITAPGGHRIGLCGDAVMQNGEMTGVRNPGSLCIRVARDFPGIATKAPQIGSVLIIGKPGSGKTTLLRDLIRRRSDLGEGSVGVVDERGELFPVLDGCSSFDPGSRTDILTGCGKAQGIELLLRTMGPRCISVDEITAEQDCNAILNAGWSGVSLLATAHAEDVGDLYKRPIYRPLINSGLFKAVLVMQNDKSWKEAHLS